MRAYMVPIVAAIIAVLLQIVLAPIVSFFSVVPNFLVALVVVLSIVRNPDTTYTYAFVLGLVADLLSSTPLGLTPLLLLIASFVLSRMFEVLDKSTFVTPLLVSVGVIFVFELLVAIVMLLMGYSAGFFDLLLYRVLPATFINSLVAVLLYFLSRKFSVAQPSSGAWAITDAQRFR